jgi:hypothetical protein
MTSGLLNPPIAAPAPAVPDVLDGPVPVVVVAGLARSGRSSVVEALLGSPAVSSPAAASPAAASSAVASSAPYVVYRWGERTTALELIPGLPRPYPLGGAPAGSRPPRRVEVTHPADVLRSLILVDTPGAGDLDAPGRDVVLDAAQRGAGLLFVTAAGNQLAVAELDLLTEAAKRGVPVVFAATGLDTAGPDTASSDPASSDPAGSDPAGLDTTGLDTTGSEPAGPDMPLVARAPGFAGAARVRLGADDPAGMAALRRALLDLVASARAGTLASSSARARTPATSGAPAVTVAAQATDEQWREVLDRETRSRRVSLVQRLAIDLATSHMRCAQEISSGRGCAGLPSALDRELHALSVRLSRALDLAAHDIAGQVFGAVLDAPPSAAVLRRIMAAAGRAMGAVEGRVVLVTATSGAALLSGRAAMASLSAVPAVDGAPPPAVGVGLTAGCFLLWQQRAGADKRDCRRWLRRAVQVLEVELERELNQRFADLREALAAVAADTVDHGVLLA